MTLRTIMRSYYYDTRKPDEAAAYKELVAKMKADKIECFETWGGKGIHCDSRFLAGVEVELETTSLFNNQWNTAPIPGISDNGMRVFDWAQDYPIDFSKSIKKGHFLTITPEMREARRNTVKCRYCGRQEPAQKGYVFCPHCIGSQYLNVSDLKLTRMKAIDDESDCEELTEAERAHLLPLYKEALLHGHTEADKARKTKERADLLKKTHKAIENANTERDGFLYFMDRGIRTDNLIYYSHTGRFCFGWRSPVAQEFLSELLDVVTEFPFPYDIKTSDGRTLSGE